MRKAAAVAVVAIVAAGGTARLSAGDRVEVRVSPQVAFAPADVNVRAMVQTDARNRAIEIIADSSDFYRSSEIQLDGDRAPHTAVFVFRDLPRGVYDVRAIVKGSNGQELAATRAQVNVVTQ